MQQNPPPLTANEIRAWIRDKSLEFDPAKQARIMEFAKPRFPSGRLHKVVVSADGKGLVGVLSADGWSETENFSFLKLLGMKPAAASDYASKLQKAARAEIADQISEFRNSSVNITGAGQYHVAHIGERNEFRHILTDFLTAKGLVAEGAVRIAWYKGAHQWEEPRFADVELAREWSAYHNERAILELQPARVNLTAKRSPTLRAKLAAAAAKGV